MAGIGTGAPGMRGGYALGTVAAVPAAVVSSTIAALQGWPSPLESVAEFLMQWTPLPVANFILAHAPTLARPAALLGSLAIVMLCGGIAGALCRSITANFIGRAVSWLAGLTFISFVLIVVLPPVNTDAELCFIGAFFAFFALISFRAPHVSGRREFFERTATIVGGATVLLSIFSIEPVFGAIAARTLFSFRRPLGLQLPGMTELVTPPSDFYIMDKVLQYPAISPVGWKLVVDGAVQKHLGIGYADLLSMPRQSRYITMECVDNDVGGRLISNALWTGVPVEHILDSSNATGDTVVFYGLDSYPESTPIPELKSRGALIAFGMNGVTLPREHGYPARLIVPGIYGFKSVKWLTRMQVVRGSRAGAWHEHGWNDTAVIHTTTRIDVAARNGREITLAGIAFAGNRGVKAVQVRVNGGPWHEAKLGPVLSRETWVQWYVLLHGPGPAKFEVRAIDGQGNPQTARHRDPYPDGASGWSTATV